MAARVLLPPWEGGPGPAPLFFDTDGAGGTAVPGLLGDIQHLGRDLAAVGEAVVPHGENRRAGAGAQAAANAVFVDRCVHMVASKCLIASPGSGADPRSVFPVFPGLNRKGRR